jgi:phosphoribosylformimino-5-aminoimidazole carboxamide ribotide isomerase
MRSDEEVLREYQFLRIVPVLDVMEGRVVRGVAGRREEYRPIESVLIDGCDALPIAQAIRTRFGLSELYLADLDAILRSAPNTGILRSLRDAGFAMTVDAGIRRCEDAAAIVAAGAHQIVAGLETLDGPQELSRLVEQLGASRVVFSLDLRDGRPLGNAAKWHDDDPCAIAGQAIGAGCTQLIVLDLASVGTAGGVPTLPLCAEIRRTWPHVTMIAGGGIRGIEDLRRLDASIIDGVLIASALHNGSIGPAELHALTR